jgi:hypothetical protein
MKLAEEFNLLQEEIYEAVKDDYTKLEASETTVEELNERSKPPASTWTYLVSDNSFEDIIGMFRGLDKLLGFSKPIAKLTFAAEYKWNELFKKEK